MHLWALKTSLAAGSSWYLDLIPLLGILLLVSGLVMMYRARRQRAMNPRITPQEQVERWRQEKGLRGDLEELMVEIEQLAKRLAAQLDAKAIRIEQLLEEADQKAAALEAARKVIPTPSAHVPEPPSAPTTPAGSSQPGDVLAAVTPEPAPIASPPPKPQAVAAPNPISRPLAPAGPIRVKTRPVTVSAPSPKISEAFSPPPAVPPAAAPATTAAPATAAVNSGTEKPSLSRSVYQLADKNLSAEQIARQLGEHVGKIELILALRDT